MSNGAQSLKLAIAAALGHQAIWIALVAVIVVVVLCATIVILVFATAKDDRVKVVKRLAPVLERLADGFVPRRAAARRRRRREGRCRSRN
jgi:Chlamydia 15 kDa cysteine-rich outer membrane protein (CRPA)